MWTSLRASAKALIPHALWSQARRRWLQRVQRDELRRIADGTPASTVAGPALAYLVNRGLANRMRAHLLAQVWAERTGRPLVVNWPRTDECFASFDDLFAWGGPRHIDRHTPRTVVEYDRYTDRASHDPQQLPAGHTGVLDLTWQFIGRGEFEARLGDRLDAARRFLRPRDDIQAEVAQTAEAWTRPMLGVHIRRGDFVTHANQGVALDRYIATIEQTLAAQPGDWGLYVASDGQAEEIAPLVERFPGRVQHQSAPGRDSAAGVRFALVQMLLLSRCQSLVLTPSSSYGEMASFLGAVPFRHA